MVCNDGGDVFAADVGMDAMRLAVERLGLAEKKAGNIEDVRAEVGEDELLEIAQERLVLKDREAGEHVDAGAEGTADRAFIEHALYFTNWPLPAEVFVDE